MTTSESSPPNVTLTDVAREMKGKVIEKPLEPTADCPPGFVRIRECAVAEMFRLWPAIDQRLGTVPIPPATEPDSEGHDRRTGASRAT